MVVTVEVVHGAGPNTIVEEIFEDIRTAASFALRLADDLGRTATPYSRGPGFASRVIVRLDGLADLEIVVFPGGLLPAPGLDSEVRLPSVQKGRDE